MVEKVSSASRPVTGQASKSASRPHRITIRLSDDFLAALDRELAREGRTDRAELVEQLLREHVQRRKRERLYLKSANDQVTTASGRQVQVHPQSRHLRPGSVEESLAATAWRKAENVASLGTRPRTLFTVETSLAEPQPLCQVAVLENVGTGTKSRFLAIQTFYSDLDGTWRPSDQIYLGRSGLPWLIESLQQAEAAIQAESSRNRKRAQEVRAARSPEEVAQEGQLRRTYIERYTRERVNKAVSLAGKHRARAQRINLTEHFSPWEWIDLCARSEFRCISCGVRANLEPHHRLELSAGGSNSKENIDPLCRFCHRDVPLEPHETAALWEIQQKRLLESFNIGDRVRLQYSNNRFSEILELFPACRGAEIPQSFADKEVKWHGADAHDWVVAKALVSWPWGKTFRKTTVELRELVKDDEEITLPER